jgi:hypothetical protein
MTSWRRGVLLLEIFFVASRKIWPFVRTSETKGNERIPQAADEAGQEGPILALKA